MFQLSASLKAATRGADGSKGSQASFPDACEVRHTGASDENVGNIVRCNGHSTRCNLDPKSLGYLQIRGPLVLKKRWRPNARHSLRQ
jgi:hypothetical protein